ncbi:hypothetical protein [Cellulomonas taurus]|uniref:hypothetical protein n=1 Tax=Cellulomonas taurus TaxID=2729175 RepID=UPI00145E9D95|nr:hypothetical protein [Cellulomonas taurus]
MRKTPAAAILIALTLALASCSGTTTYAKIASERDQARAEAQEIFPPIVSQLGGEMVDSWGEWSYGGTKNIDRRQYAVKAQFDVASPPDSQTLINLFEDLGYPIVQYPKDGNPALIGEKDGFRLSISVTDASTNTVMLRSPWRKMRPHTPQPLVGREPLDLNMPSPTST